jgi:hypothetical protein
MDPEWKYSDVVSAERQQALRQPPPFQVISSWIAETMHVICRHLDRCDEVDGYNRVVYCITVERQLFDLFFNSRNGYRASYFRSPVEGTNMNIHLLKTLAPTLQAFQPDDDIDPTMVRSSLSVSSGKAWLAEVGKGFCPQCYGEWRTAQDNQADILNGCWELSPVPDARNGRKAPFLTKIRVMGGLVNPVGADYVPVNKCRRAEDIYDIGWS